MSPPTPICLKYAGEVPSIVQSRVSYAFRVFAAIYNYRVVDTATDGQAICLEYGQKPSPENAATRFHIPARYRPRSWESETRQLGKFRYANEDMHISHGVDETTGKPDWLGEIFEWISSSYEKCIKKRDSIGRIPFCEMVFSKQGICPRKPYASLLMAWLENTLRNGNGVEALAKAPSPMAGAEHIVICSHDIDFYHVKRTSTLVRLLKNLGISLHTSPSGSFFASNLNLLAHLTGGKQVGDFLPAMLERIGKRGFQSTLFVVPQPSHRRDPNCALRQLIPHLSVATGKGFSIDLHGSYASVIDNGTLRPEALALEQAVGQKPNGNRQHWLRFDSHEKLFRAIEAADLKFDSTLGFSDMVGFRNGASFAFPPYDFKNEKPYRFLEIPLALMDVNIEAASRALREDPQRLAEEVLAQSRRLGWGGISVLWHNPMEPLHVPKEINRVFWDSAPTNGAGPERWMTAEQFMALCLSRYQNAGLMEGVHAGS